MSDNKPLDEIVRCLTNADAAIQRADAAEDYIVATFEMQSAQTHALLAIAESLQRITNVLEYMSGGYSNAA